jgi:hypothetical protein
MVQVDGNPAKKPADAHSILARCTAPAKFTVDIVGNTSASFKNSGGLDVWEGEGQKSQPQSGINSIQILGPTVDKQGRLIFYDLNQGDPVTLNYRLNFNNGVPSVDPIVDNGGGNWQ